MNLQTRYDIELETEKISDTLENEVQIYEPNTENYNP